MNLAKAAAGTVPVMLALLALASPARAAESGASAGVPTARETEVDVGLDVGYDSNAARSDAELAARRGLKLSDEITTPSLDFAIARPVGRALLFLKGDSDYAIHAVNKKRDQLEYSFDGGATGRYLSCQETLTGDYISAQTDLAELDSIVINNTRVIKDAKFSADCGRVTGLAPQISASNSWVSNSSPRLQAIDNQTVTVDAALGYRRPVLGTISVFGEYAQSTYPPFTGPSNIPGGPTGQTTAFGYYIYSGGLKYERHEGRLDATLSVSYTRLDPYSGGIKPFRGFTYSFDAAYSLSTRLKTHASATLATVPSNRVFANYKVDETYTADVSYTLSSRLTVKASGEVLNSNYAVSSQGVQTIGITSENVYTALASATYTLTKRLEVTLSAGDVERLAHAPGGPINAGYHDLSYSSTTVTLGLKAKF